MKKIKLVSNKLSKKVFALLAFALLSIDSAFAQSGKDGLIKANTMIRDMFGDVQNLVYGIAGLVGFVGAIRCYVAWNSGDQDVNKKIMGWFGACIFIVVAGLVITSFFGVQGTP